MKKKNKIYIAKPDTWYKEGYQVKLIDDMGDMGLFEGIRICENPLSEGKWHTVGEEYEDEEICTMDEFIIEEE